MNSSQDHTNVAVTVAIGTLSFLMALLMIVSVVVLRLYKSISHRLILYLAIADLIQAIATVINYRWVYMGYIDEESRICTFQGFLYTIGDNSSAFWSACICVYVVTYGFFNKKLPHFETIAFAISWGLPVIFACLAFAIPSSGEPPVYGKAGAFCWIRPKYYVGRIMFLYLWIFSILLLLICLYSFMAWELYKMAQNPTHTETQKAKVRLHRVMRKLLGYPIAFSFVFMPMAAQRISEAAQVQTPFGYELLAVSLFVSNGIWNSVVYGTTRQIYKRLLVYLVTGRDANSSSPDKHGQTSNPSIGTLESNSLAIYEKPVNV